MQEITVIATIIAKSEDIEFVKRELCKLVEPTKQEYGCIEYTFYQDDKEPEFFHSYEKWYNQAAIDAHLQSRHIKNYMEATKYAVTDFVIREMSEICARRYRW